MLSSYEVPQVSDLFAAYAGLIYISLPPHASAIGVAIDVVSIYLLELKSCRNTECSCESDNGLNDEQMSA
ncbi:hypothetical protein [Yersinia pseudotuberculosis]|uniref:hypothetical protein n=1 Tax=Yersinia pseudotuberculosis TaxID=633 RepID=UPI0038B68A8E